MVHFLDVKGDPLATREYEAIKVSDNFDFVVMLGEVDPELAAEWGEPVILTPEQAHKMANGKLDPKTIETGYKGENVFTFNLGGRDVKITAGEYEENIGLLAGLYDASILEQFLSGEAPILDPLCLSADSEDFGD